MGGEPDGTDALGSDPGKEARAAAGIPIVPAFDGYRAFAIIGVIMLHVITVSGVVAFGDEGLLSQLTWATFGRAVEILFVVSGFVVFLPTVARDGSFGSWRFFAIRRGARLLPAYWMILVISLILLGTGSLGSVWAFPSIFAILANFTGIEVPLIMLTDTIPVGFGVNPPLWTLSIELGFYIVMPFIASAYYRHPWIGLAIAAMITLCWDLLFDHMSDIYGHLGIDGGSSLATNVISGSGAQLPVWAFSFALGMTGAWVYVRVTRSVRARDHMTLISGAAFGGVVATALFAYLCGGYFDQTRESVLLSMAFSLSLAVTLITWSLLPRVWQLPFSATPVRKLGDYSYGMYLAHFLFVYWLGLEVLGLDTDGSPSAVFQWLGVILISSTIYGYLSGRFLEQPIRRWARRFGNRSEA